MAKTIKLLHVSLSPNCYDLKKISKMTFDEALDFCEKDTIGSLTYGFGDIDYRNNYEYHFHADGVEYGDGSDTMFNWIKVCDD